MQKIIEDSGLTDGPTAFGRVVSHSVTGESVSNKPASLSWLNSIGDVWSEEKGQSAQIYVDILPESLTDVRGR